MYCTHNCISERLGSNAEPDAGQHRFEAPDNAKVAAPPALSGVTELNASTTGSAVAALIIAMRLKSLLRFTGLSFPT